MGVVAALLFCILCSSVHARSYLQEQLIAPPPSISSSDGRCRYAFPSPRFGAEVTSSVLVCKNYQGDLCHHTLMRPCCEVTQLARKHPIGDTQIDLSLNRAHVEFFYYSGGFGSRKPLGVCYRITGSSGPCTENVCEPQSIDVCEGNIDVSGTCNPDPNPDNGGGCDCQFGYRGPNCCDCDVNFNMVSTGSGSRCEPICENLTNISHGVVIVPSTTVGSVARYSCNGPYVLDGDPTRTCVQVGTTVSWSPSQEPVCMLPECPDLTNPSNGVVTVNTTTLGSVAHYRCIGDYILVGIATTTCVKDTVTMTVHWSPQEPVCQLPECPVLRSPEHGVVLAPIRTLGSVAVYSCGNDCILAGDPTRTCVKDTDGTVRWLPHHEPYCKCQCRTLRDPLNGMVLVPSRFVGDIAKYICDEGYELVGDTTRKCEIVEIVGKGKVAAWWGDEPTCTRNPECPPLRDPLNGRVLVPSRFVGDKATYICNDGYELVGDSPRKCEEEGGFAFWWGDEPTCTPTTPKCQRLTDPLNGEVHHTTLTVDSTATYTCNQGYLVEGVRSRRCQQNTQWDREEPTCQPTCPGNCREGQYDDATGCGLGQCIGNHFPTPYCCDCKNGFALQRNGTCRQIINCRNGQQLVNGECPDCGKNHDVLFLFDYSTSFDIVHQRKAIAGLQLIFDALRGYPDIQQSLIVYPIKSQFYPEYNRDSGYIFSPNTQCRQAVSNLDEYAGNRSYFGRSNTTQSYTALQFVANNVSIDPTRRTSVITITDGYSDASNTLERIREQINAIGGNVDFFSIGVKTHLESLRREGDREKSLKRFGEEMLELGNGKESHTRYTESRDITDALLDELVEAEVLCSSNATTIRATLTKSTSLYYDYLACSAAVRRGCSSEHLNIHCPEVAAQDNAMNSAGEEEKMDLLSDILSAVQEAFNRAFTSE